MFPGREVGEEDVSLVNRGLHPPSKTNNDDSSMSTAIRSAPQKSWMDSTIENLTCS